jgi:V8-like Glu-specific endopeptidase
MRAVTRALTAILLVATVAASGAVPVAFAGDSGDRTLVTAAQLADRPFRSLVLVTVGDRVVCTGFVIAPTKVVTAGHCVARDAAGGDFRFRGELPGGVRLDRAYSQIAGGSPFDSCRVSRVWAHPRFIKRDASDTAYGSRAHDYAVLTTSPDCVYPDSAVMRLWPTSSSDGQLPTGSAIKLGGYPADPRFADMNGLNLWRSQGKVQPPTGEPALLDTTGFVAQGMSGGPVWRTFDADSPCGRAQCVVAILTECAVNGQGRCKLGDNIRRAVRITPTVMESLARR